MNKVICDICGTMYPETSSKCPICGGSHRPGDKVVQVVDPEVESPGGKSGRNYSSGRTKLHGGGSNRGLVITIVVLLLAILLVGLYIGYRFYGGMLFEANRATEDTTPSTEATEPTVPCTALQLSNNVIELNAVGMAWLLDVEIEPADTTDTVQFISSKPTVATVTDQGRVTAVAPGQAVITVICGGLKQECRVVCDFETTQTEATESEPTSPTTDAFELSRTDISFFSEGESYRFETGAVSASEITWTSENENVATIRNGTVTAVGPGTTTIHAVHEVETDGVVVTRTGSCIIRCQFGSEDDTPKEPTTPNEPSDTGIHLSSEDVTIEVGESFTLRLLDANGQALSVTWAVSDSGVCTVSGNSVTGGASGMATVSTTYDGQTYSCIVRVR